MSSRLLATFLIILLAFSAVRCAPAEGVLAQFNPLGTATATPAGRQSGDTVTLDNPAFPPSPITPMPRINPSDTNPGAAPGGAPSESGGAPPSQNEPPPNLQPPNISAWQQYTDSNYGYTVKYPASNLAAKVLSSAELAQLAPRPVAAVQFQIRNSQVADLEPPAFSIAIFENKTGLPLDKWMAANGLSAGAAGTTNEPFNTPYVSGIMASRQTLIAPGVFYYVSHGSYVYRLTPLGSEGEAMLNTFAFTK